MRPFPSFPLPFSVVCILFCCFDHLLHSLLFASELFLHYTNTFTPTISGCVLCVCILSRFSHVQLFATPWTVTTRLLGPWDSPGKNTGVACHTLLQESSQPRDGTGSPTFAGRCFTTEPAGKLPVHTTCHRLLGQHFPKHIVPQ